MSTKQYLIRLVSVACIEISAHCFNIKRHTVSVCSSPPTQPHAVRLCCCDDEVCGRHEEVMQRCHISCKSKHADIGTKGAADHMQPAMAGFGQDVTSVRQMGQRQSLPCFLADISSFVQPLHKRQHTVAAPSNILYPHARSY